MLVNILLLGVSLGIILLAAVIFTNAVEMLGQQLGLHQGAVGSVLAAVGTALPETVIPIIAILWIGDDKAKDVAIGAIAGAPLMLATLAFFVTGAAVVGYRLLGRRELAMSADLSVICRDLAFFLPLYGMAVLATVWHDSFAFKAVIAIALVLAYGVYIKVTLNSVAMVLENVEQLHLARLCRTGPGMPLVLGQLVIAVGMMVGGAHLFVKNVEAVSTAAGVSALILSLVITPIATELPEKFNSVIWIGKRKDTLALGNITGAMVFQCCFPVAFGLVGTHWDLTRDHGITLLSAGLALASSLTVLVWMRVRRTLNPYVLLAGGLFYAVFIAYLVAQR